MSYVIVYPDLLEKTLWFNFNVIWVPGSKNGGPDYMFKTKEARLDCIMGLTRTTTDPEGITVNGVNIIDIVGGTLASCLSNNEVRAITFDEIEAEVLKD